MSPARYASETKVPIEKSREEIEKLLHKYGAKEFGYMMLEDRAHIQFMMHGKRIRFTLPFPSRLEKQFREKLTRGEVRRMNEAQSVAAWQQSCMQRWRALRLSILAKLEAVECKISQFEEEFLANIVDPATNRTVYECVAPALKLINYEKPDSGNLIALPAPSKE